MSDHSKIIRDRRIAERNRRNNSWSEPAVLDPILSDNEILGEHFTNTLSNSPYLDRKRRSYEAALAQGIEAARIARDFARYDALREMKLRIRPFGIGKSIHG